MALALALAVGPAQAQQGKGEPVPSGTGGVGIHIDVGGLLRGLGTLLGTAQPADPPPGYIEGQLVAAWDEAEPIDPGELAAGGGGTVRDTTVLPALGLRLAVLQVPGQQEMPALQALRARHPTVTFDRHAVAEPMAAAARHYAQRLVGAEPAPRPLGVPVRIGIIDGDPEGLEPALEATPLHRQVLGQPRVGARHAAAVACLIACRSGTGWTGLARGSELFVAAVLHRDQAGFERSDTFTLARAFDWLIHRGAQVVNVSLGSAPDRVLAEVVQRVQRRGVLVVAAAGNGGTGTPLPYPAALPGVVAVAAVDAEAEPYARGSRGENVLVAAPGVDLWLPVDGGTYFTGTSYAAPFVTAWIAQRLARGASADAAALCASARDLPPAGRDGITGCGLLQFLP